VKCIRKISTVFVIVKVIQNTVEFLPCKDGSTSTIMVYSMEQCCHLGGQDVTGGNLQYKWVYIALGFIYGHYNLAVSILW
jgi:hypothetical protein